MNLGGGLGSAFVFRLGLDVACALVLSYAFYLRRYRRQDLAFVYVAFNVGVFSSLSVIRNDRFTVAIGFGIFGVLSIIRLRSETYDNTEIGYFFLSLVLAIVNGLDTSWRSGALLNGVVLATIALGDLSRMRNALREQLVVLDRVIADEQALAAHLGELLGAEIVSVTPLSSDYVKEISQVRVSYRPPQAAAR